MERFNVFVESLSELSYNTRKNYCHHVADAYDYILEGCYYLASRADGVVSRSGLRKVIESWGDYLVDGHYSKNEIASAVAAMMPSPLVSTTTRGPKIAALRRFLQLSDQVQEERAAFSLYASEAPSRSAELLFPEISQVIALHSGQKNSLIQKSMLSGVVSGGPKTTKKSVLNSSVRRKDDRFVGEPFPFDQVIPFVEKLSSYRDKALYSLYAASGCRQHEALQMLWSDIDARSSSVQLIDPRSRSNFHTVYAALDESEKDRLAWKSRETAETMLIEPFRSMFFRNLKEYLRHEYHAHNQHQFVFQHVKSEYIGRPFFLSSSSTRNESFDRALLALNIDPRVRQKLLGPHSFRHMYGTYVLNFLPREDGSYGMPIEDVRLWMGHANVENTKRYAVKDKELQRAALRYANAHIFNGGTTKTLNDLRIEALMAQVEALENENVRLLEGPVA